MLKLLLSLLVALILVVEPVSAAGAGAGVHKPQRQAAQHQPPRKASAQPRTKAKSVAKASVKGKRKAAVQVAEERARLVRRVEIVRGKRRVSYQLVRRAAPVTVLAAAAAAAPRTAGDEAGLNQTRDPLSLRSSVALVLDQNSAEVLFEKNASVALPIASITKLMTGLVVVDAGQALNETLVVADDDVDRHKYSSSRLPVGARMTRADLLHIALMSSENRAAAALARNYPGGSRAFVAAMNAKARALGMQDTHYVDASGLSSENVSSARDLAKLVAVAHHRPLLRQFSTDPNWIVEASGRLMRYNNTNYLVAQPDWNIGLQKTGFINEAGRCLVMQAMIQGRNVIMVFLDSKGKMSRTADAGRMRRWLEALTPQRAEAPDAAVNAGVNASVNAGVNAGVNAAHAAYSAVLAAPNLR